MLKLAISRALYALASPTTLHPWKPERCACLHVWALRTLASQCAPLVCKLECCSPLQARALRESASPSTARAYKHEHCTYLKSRALHVPASLSTARVCKLEHYATMQARALHKPSHFYRGFPTPLWVVAYASVLLLYFIISCESSFKNVFHVAYSLIDFLLHRCYYSGLDCFLLLFYCCLLKLAPKVYKILQVNFHVFSTDKQAQVECLF